MTAAKSAGTGSSASGFVLVKDRIEVAAGADDAATADTADAEPEN